MKNYFMCLFSLAAMSSSAQPVDGYFERIRNNEAALTAFFSQMPKGGDLHHHYTGSVYTETYIEFVIARDYWINKKTLEVNNVKSGTDSNWTRFSFLKKTGQLETIKDKLFQKWSIKGYNQVSYPPEKLFFETFGNFSIASKNNLDQGLLELKKRAQTEHVSYIETMFTSIDSKKMDLSSLSKMNDLFRKKEVICDSTLTTILLDSLYRIIQEKGASTYACVFNDSLQARHERLKIDDSTFTMRYMNYVTRVMEPVEVFKSLVISFESANTSSLVVGVNIVAPEDHETAMRDYGLHMQMFNFCHRKYPGVKISLHAGELSLGFVKPEDLTWHINSAIYTGNANRIGHGVDIAYEKDCYRLLQYMKQNEIAVEINLSSNEFILRVAGNEHPFSLYLNFNVPIVISTDDAGVLRSNLIRQFVLLATRYKDVHYSDIKSFVYNSINYSFIEEPDLKSRLLASLTNEFKVFESHISKLLSQAGGISLSNH